MKNLHRHTPTSRRRGAVAATIAAMAGACAVGPTALGGTTPGPLPAPTTASAAPLASFVPVHLAARGSLFGPLAAPLVEPPVRAMLREAARGAADARLLAPAPAGDEVLDAFGVAAGVVFPIGEIAVGEFGLRFLEVPAPLGLGTGSLELALRPRSVRAADFVVVSFDDAGEPVVHRDLPVHTVAGTVSDADGRELEGATIAGSVHRGDATLAIRLADGTRYFIEPVSRAIDGALPGQHILYAASDVLESKGFCGADHTADGGQGHDHGHDHDGGEGGIASDGGVAGGGTPCDTQLVVDCDFPFFQLQGSSEDATAIRVETIMSIVNQQYVAEGSIRHLLTGIVVRSTAAADPYVAVDMCSAGPLLEEVTALWGNTAGAGTYLSGIERDAVHLFTGRVGTGSFIGCAWPSDVCANAADHVAHGVSRVDSPLVGGSTAASTDLVAHELGHNWGANHCDCVDPPSTMNAFLTSANTFSVLSRFEILAWRLNHDSCLDCSGAANDGCGDPSAGNPWLANGGPYSNDSECCARVCVADSYCCNTEWDEICARRAVTTCASCGPGNGTPFVARTTPGCNDADCCLDVCGADTYCCDNEWDQVCVARAEWMCRSGGSCQDAIPWIEAIPETVQFSTATGSLDAGSSCGTSEGRTAWRKWTANCNGLATASVCTEFAEGQMTLTVYEGCTGVEVQCSAEGPECGLGGSVRVQFGATAGTEYRIRISTNGAGNSAGSLAISCASVCGSGGECTAANAGPGCNDADCCVAVCNLDPFCCTTQWDSLCIDGANTTCYATAGDFNGDGVVDAADLSIMLSNWGGTGSTDLDGDGVTGAADLSVLLGNWG